MFIKYLPNLLSMYRLVIAPYLIYLAVNNEKVLFANLLMISLSTDILDGIIARKFKSTSSFGSRLDSAGDTITFIAGLIGLLKFEERFLLEQKNILILALAFYLFRLFFSVARYKKPSSFHTYLAKAAAVLQGLFFLTVFYFGLNKAFFYFTVSVSILVTVEEIILIMILPEWTTDVKGLLWILKSTDVKQTKLGKE